MHRELQLRNLSSRALFGAEAYWMFKDRDEAQERTNGICNDKKILWERDEKGRGQLFEYMSLEKGLDIWNFLPEWNWATKHFQKWLKKILFCFKYGNYGNTSQDNDNICFPSRINNNTSNWSHGEGMNVCRAFISSYQNSKPF